MCLLAALIVYQKGHLHYAEPFPFCKLLFPFGQQTDCCLKKECCLYRECSLNKVCCFQGQCCLQRECCFLGGSAVSKDSGVICYPSLPLSRHVWSNVAPEVSLLMDAGVSSFDPRLVSSRPTGFTDGHFLISRCKGLNHFQLCHTSRSSLKCQLHSDITCWQFLYTSSLVTLPACAVHSPAF